MRCMFLIAGLVLLSACGDWPDLGVGDEVSGYPRLVPFDEVVGPGVRAEDAVDAAAEADEALLARADALRARGARLGPSDDDRAAFETLRDRAPPPGG